MYWGDLCVSHVWQSQAKNTSFDLYSKRETSQRPPMQGQRSTLQSLTDTFEFDHGSSPNDSSVDQPHYWNNILNPDDAQNLPDYLPSPTGSNALYLSSVSHDGGSLPNWNHDGSSSGDHIRQQCGHESGKMEHRWMDSLASCAGPSLRLEERLELNNHRSRESVDINLNSDQVESRPWFPNSTSSNIPQNQNFNVGFAGNGGQVAESHPYKPCGSENEQISSASGAGDPCATTSATMIDYLADAGNGRPSGSLDGRNLSCKRKALEGVSGQTSLSASASFFQRAENSVWHPVSASHGSGSSLSISGNPEEPISSANFHEELMNQRFGSARRGVSASDCHPAAFYVADNSQRNFRMRINPALHDSTEPSNLCASASNASSRISHVRSSHQSSSGVLPFTHNVETRPAATTATGTSSVQPSQHPAYPQNVHPYAFHRPHSLRAGSSSNSSVVSGDRPSVLHDEAYPSSLPRSISENPVFVPATELRQLTQDRTNWNSLNGNVSAAANLASSSRINSNSTGVHSTPALTWVPHHTPPRYTRRLSEIIRRSLFPTSSSEPGGQSSNLPPIGLGASQGMALPSVFSQRGGHQHSHLRSALRMDRHGDAVMGVPLSLQSLAGAPEGRSRLASEIRNVLDLVRRGESLRFEDVVILDPSDFYGVADLHDRHRDLRLDVDNMSYEELLALEERIGNVNTGLSEETVFKFLKRSNFLQVAAEAPQEVEPCCICREEYVEGEELGTLECGHDFHTSCIKQWLMVKNLCPICKKTGLIT